MISRRLLDFGEQTLGKIRYRPRGRHASARGPPSQCRRSPRCPACTSAQHTSTATVPPCHGPGSWAGRSTPTIGAGDRGARSAGRSAPRSACRRRSRPPLAAGAVVDGKARISDEIPERVVIETEAAMPAYLVCPTPSTPAGRPLSTAGPHPSGPRIVAFRAVFSAGESIRSSSATGPAGFELGLVAYRLWCRFSALIFWFWPAGSVRLVPEHYALSWPVALAHSGGSPRSALIVILSAVAIGPGGRPQIHTRWKTGVHQHTWGAGIAAMKLNRK